jgi:hypothetical protein
MALSRFDAETLFLIDLCAANMGLSSRRPAVEEGFDWNRFLDVSARHRVEGIVYRAFCCDIALAPPPDVLASLRRMVAAQATVRAILLAEWRRASEALRAAGVRVLMMKGPALSIQLYGEPSRRAYRDIDLLIEADLMDRGIQAFASIGYSINNDEFEEDLPRRDFLQRKLRHIVLKRDGLPVYFELHAAKGRDIGLAPLDAGRVFDRSESLTWEGTLFPTLSKGDHALLVVLHGAHHAWCSLQWVLDSMALLRDPSVRLDLTSMRTWPGEDPQYSMDCLALLAHRLFGAHCLDGYLPPMGARMRRAVALSRYPLSLYCTGGPRILGRIVFIRGLFFNVKSHRGGIARFKSIAAFARPSINDVRSLPGVGLPIFAYYILRPFLVVSRQIKRASGGDEGLVGRRS